ncbi:MAG: Holliday junction branch migration protein RuvA [Thiohalomonadales bacterium]
MIGRLTGNLVLKQAPALLLDVNGVCYELEAPMSTFYELPEPGVVVTLHTHMLVREDAQLLYGFLQYSDRTIFRILIKINGVGAKLALALMSNMSSDEMVVSVNNEDVDRFIKVPGVGKKTAARLMVELKDKFTALQIGGEPRTQGHDPVNAGCLMQEVKTDPVRDAVSALMSLGYKPPEASRMVSGVDSKGLASDQIIKLALRSVIATV